MNERRQLEQSLTCFEPRWNFLCCVFCRPTSSAISSLPPPTVVIQRRTPGSCQAVILESCPKKPSAPRLLALISFYRFIFLPLFSPSTPRLLSPIPIRPVCLAGGDTWQALCPHPSPTASLPPHVRLWSSASPQQRWVFSLSSDGRIASAVFTQGAHVLTEAPVGRCEGSAKQVPFRMTATHFEPISFISLILMKRDDVIPRLWYLIEWDHRHDLTRYWDSDAPFQCQPRSNGLRMNYIWSWEEC